MSEYGTLRYEVVDRVARITLNRPRYRNAQSRVLEETFVTRGMPYLLVRGTRFYDRREVKDALAYLRLLHNPEDSVGLNRIINVPARAIGAKTIADLERWAFQLGVSP